MVSRHYGDVKQEFVWKLYDEIRKRGWDHDRDFFKVGKTLDGEYLMARGRHRLEALKCLVCLGVFPRDFKIRCVVLTPRRGVGEAPNWPMGVGENWNDEDWVAEYARCEAFDNQLQRDLVLAHESEAAELQDAMVKEAKAMGYEVEMLPVKVIDCTWQPVDIPTVGRLSRDIERYGWKQSSVIKVAVKREGEYMVLRGLHRVSALSLIIDQGFLPQSFQVCCIVLRPPRRMPTSSVRPMDMGNEEEQSMVADYERWEEIGKRMVKDKVMEYLAW